MLRVVTIVLAIEERMLSGKRAEEPRSAASKINAAHT
jgi:hypothetical protein